MNHTAHVGSMTIDSNLNITRENVTVLPGQIWGSTDKRDDSRPLMRVVAVANGSATVRAGADGTGRKTRIRVSRMYAHATGYRLVRHADGSAA